MKKALVCGAGGFIGGHMVAALLGQGYRVGAVDQKPLDHWCQLHAGAESRVLDLQRREACAEAVRGYDEVYNFAADMGGMGFIENTRRCAC